MTHSRYSKGLIARVLDATPIDKPTTVAAIHRAMGVSAHSTVRAVLVDLAKEGKVKRLDEGLHHRPLARYWRTDGWSK